MSATALSRPDWSDPEFDRVDESQNPDDRGVEFQSAAVDAWAPAETEELVSVHVWGVRHERSADFPDEVLVVGDVNPGCVGGVCLQVPDARRLALALLAACDLAEQGAAE